MEKAGALKEPSLQGSQLLLTIEGCENTKNKIK
jgi:hypothetical protein